jgi:hypothetical protein
MPSFRSLDDAIHFVLVGFIPVECQVAMHLNCKTVDDNFGPHNHDATNLLYSGCTDTLVGCWSVQFERLCCHCPIVKLAERGEYDGSIIAFFIDVF